MIAAVESKGFPPNGGSYRLASIAALLMRDLAKAQSFSDLAVAAAPAWFQVRIQAARMAYISALLPHFPMVTHIAWPVPPDIEYVRSDAESIGRLRVACAEFAALAQFESNERQDLEAWHLACLANLPDRHEDAARFAAGLLARTPNHLPAAVWCLQRNLPVERDALLRAVAPSQTTLTPDSAQAICQLHIRSGDFASAMTQLDSARAVFVEAGVEFAWRFMRAQVAAALDRMDEARRFVSEEVDGQRRREIEIAVERVQARRTGSMGPLARIADVFYTETQNPKYLYEAVEASLESGDVGYVVDKGDLLLRDFPTAEALKIVLRGAFRAGRYEQFLRSMRAHRSLFADGTVPKSIRRLEIECLWQVGELNGAVAGAEALVREAGDTENLFSLFAAQIASADLRGGAHTARQIIARQDVSVSGLLYLARSIYIEDLSLATAALRAVIQRNPFGNEIAAAVYLGFQIGAEADVAPLMRDFYALAQQPGAAVKMFSFPEIQEFMRRNAQQRDHVWRVFGEGAVPAHFAAKSLNIELAVFYREQPRLARDSEQPLRDTPTLIRAGSRPPLASPAVGAGEIFMDVTALLLAEDQGLLDIVEKTFAPIHISTHLLDSLRAQIEKVAPHQPSRKIPRDDVLRMVDKKRVEIFPHTAAPAELLTLYADQLGDRWCSALAHAVTDNAWLCDFTPPMSFVGPPATIAPEHLRRIVSGADVVCALQRAGAVSEEERDRMLALLGDARGLFHQDLTLVADSRLVLDTGLAEVLAEAGVLEVAADFLTVEICEEEVTQLRGENEAHAQRLNLVDWLKSLLERVQRGLSANIYGNIPRNEASTELSSESPDDRCLRDCLSAKVSGAKVVWCDDRWLTRHEHANDLPIYGVSEILRVLRNGAQLSASAYYEALLRLRASNLRYLPLEKDELLYHLRRAPVTSHGLQETPALALLRRYTAACTLDRFRLHRPGKDQHGKAVVAEFTLAVETQRAAADALASLWGSGQADAVCRNRAEWLLNQVVAPLTGFIEAHSGLPQLTMGDGITSHLATLFISGFSLTGSRTFSRDESQPRALFYRWLYERLVAPIERVEPEIVDNLADHLVRDFLRRDRRMSQENQRGIRHVTVRWIIDLPDALTSELTARMSKETKKWLGIKPGEFKVGAFGRSFKWKPFWFALTSAADGAETTVSSEDDEEFQFQPPLSNQPIYRVPASGPNLDPKTRLTEPMLRGLVGSMEQRRAYLSRRKDWFDIPDERRRQLVTRIVQATHPAEAVGLIEDSREESAELFYRQALRRLRIRDGGNTDRYRPRSVAMLRNHLRILEEPDFHARAFRLIHEVGLAWTIERFAALPITLPTPILNAVVSMPEAKRRALFARLRRRLVTPLGRLHLAHLLAIAAVDSTNCLDEAKRVVAGLLHVETSRRQWKLFGTLLEWTRRLFLTLPEFRQLEGSSLLAITWLHAGRLHQVLELGGADAESAFAMAADSIGLIPDHSVTEFWQDAAHPTRAGRLNFILRGLGSAILTLPEAAASALRLEVIDALQNSEQFTDSAALLIRETGGLPNALGSFLGGNGHQLLGSILGPDLLSKTLPISPDGLIAASIADLELAPESPDAWRTLMVCAADHRLPPNTASALDVFLNTLDMPKILRALSDREAELFLFISGRCALTQSLPLREKCEELIFTRARNAAQSELSESDLRKRTGLFAGCLMLLAVVPEDEAGTHERMHKLLVQLLQAWPAASRILRLRFDGWPTHLPLTRQRGFWELEMTLRAMC